LYGIPKEWGAFHCIRFISLRRLQQAWQDTSGIRVHGIMSWRWNATRSSLERSY